MAFAAVSTRGTARHKHGARRYVLVYLNSVVDRLQLVKWFLLIT